MNLESAIIYLWIFFQSQFNQITFRVIGDDTAPTYFDVFGASFTSLNQGEVRVAANLANDNRDLYYVSNFSYFIGASF